MDGAGPPAGFSDLDDQLLHADAGDPSSPAAPPAGFSDLDDQLLHAVVRWLPLEDLCRCCRVCRRLKGVVDGAQDVWQALYRQAYPPAAAPAAAAAAAAAAALGSTSDSNAGGAGAGGGPDAAPQQQQAGQPESQRHAAGGSSLAAAAAAAGLASLPAASNAGEQLGKRKRAAAGATEAAAAAASTSSPVVDWRERFKTRYVEASRQLRLKRAARRLKAESASQAAAQEVHRAEQALARERRALPALRAELLAVQRAQQAAAAAAVAEAYWLPVAVQQAHHGGVVTQQQTQDAAAHEQDLQQRLAVAELEVRKLTRALEARRRRADEARRKLQALLP